MRVPIADREFRILRLARRTVMRVLARMAKTNGHVLQRPLLSPRIHRGVIDVHAPSAERRRSYGVGPVSVPPTDVGSSHRS